MAFSIPILQSRRAYSIWSFSASESETANKDMRVWRALIITGSIVFLVLRVLMPLILVRLPLYRGVLGLRGIRHFRMGPVAR